MVTIKFVLNIRFGIGKISHSLLFAHKFCYHQLQIGTFGNAMPLHVMRADDQVVWPQV